jgi:hypothetical protein
MMYTVALPGFLIALLVFGFAPRALLRLIVLAFPRDHPRRRELLADLHVVPRIERPFFVLEALELAIFEGVWERVRRIRQDRISRRSQPKSVELVASGSSAVASGGTATATATVRAGDVVRVTDRATVVITNPPFHG